VKSIYAVAAAAGIEDDVKMQLDVIKSCILHIKDYKKFLKKICLLPNEGANFVDFLKANLTLSDELVNFLNLLLHNDRLGLIVDICDAYSAFLDQIRGKKFFYLTCANNVSRVMINRLIDDLKSNFGGEIECVVTKDMSLIGGVKLQYRSRILDYSVRSRLRRLHNAIRRENYEN
jgi:F-type H+-transporting ATPase subunit delta